MKGLETIRFIALLALIALVPGCKCTCDDPTDPDCKNYDPCYGVEETSADFTIYEPLADPAYYPDVYRDYLVETDTIYGSLLFLEINKSCDSVKWKVGLEPNWRTGKSVFINFDTNRVGTINITCVAFRQPNKACYPNDDGIDTVMKDVCIGRIIWLDITGMYKGKFVNDNPNYTDSFVMGIRIDSSYPYYFLIDSIDKEQAYPQYDNGLAYSKGGRVIFDAKSSNIKLKPILPRGYIIGDSIMLEYYSRSTINTSEQGAKYRKFIGYKL